MARAMKDSGIEWIGEIPEGWEIGRIKYNYYLKGRIGWQGLKADEFVDEGPYLVTGTDFNNGRVNWATCYHISQERFDEAPEIHVKEGDLLITKDGTVGKVAYIEEKPDKVSLNSHLLIMRPYNSKYSNRFLYWVIQSPVFYKFFLLSQNGTVMSSLSQEKINDFSYAMPDKQIQIRIADFLDAECARIDAVIEQTRASIEEYKKLKQSVITQAVTKGIRPGRKMKDSGVEWIGEIAEEFELKKLKYVCEILDQYRSPITADQRNQDAEVLYDYYGASGAIDKIDGYTIDDHVMLIGEDGANLRMRNLPLMYEVNGKAWINNHAHILKPRSGMDFYYLFFALESLDINPYITGSAQPKLSQDNLKNIWLPVPTLDEQIEIAGYIKEQTRKIDALIRKKKLYLSELESYKKSLIFEYVTGKKEVR